MELREQVRLVRMKLRLTQAQLAEKTGISLVTIARWESKGSTKPQAVSYGKFLDFCKENAIGFEDEEEI